MKSAHTTSDPDHHDCVEFVVPHGAPEVKSSSYRRFVKLRACWLHLVLLLILGSMGLAGVWGSGMGIESGSWLALVLTGVAAVPLLKRLKSRNRLLLFAAYSALILGHAILFHWPLDLVSAQLVVGSLGVAFMISFKGSEKGVAYIVGSGFLFGTILDHHHDCSIECLGVALLVSLLVGATLVAIGGAIKAERESLREYRNFIDSAPLPMWEVDLRGIGELVVSLRSQGISDFCLRMQDNEELLQETWNRLVVLEVNPEGHRLLPATGPDASPLSAISSPLGRALMIALLKAFWAGGRVDEIAVSVGEGPSAQHYRFQAYGGLPVGDVSRVTVIASDVSKDKNQGVELARQIVNRERFVASIAHEIRTPLSTVVGLAQSILETPEMDAGERSELLDLMIRDGQDLAGIVEDLLVGARLNMGTLKIVLQDVPVRSEIDSVLAALGMRAEVDGRPGSAVVGNRMRFRQVVRNMLTNAGRYGGSEVRVVYGSNGTTGFVEVRDDGAPVPPDQREKMFEAYERLHDRPGVTDSVGLGLPVSRSLARAMGGDLEYDHDGQESIFRLSLPVAKTSRLPIEVGATA